MSNNYKKAIKIFEDSNGILTTSNAIKLGVHPSVLYKMRDDNIIEKFERGLYRLSSLPPLTNPDLIIIAKKVPDSVICLISALYYYELTDQIPYKITIAIENFKKRLPWIKYPPIKVYRLTKKSFISGIETHMIDNIPVKIYSPEKTITDCFKFRNKIGIDIAIDALKKYNKIKKVDINKIMKFAKIDRVQNVIKPYIEGII